jgi:hypothetical protein
MIPVCRALVGVVAVLGAGCGGAWSIATTGPVRAGLLETPSLALRPDGSGLVAVEASVNGGTDCDEPDTLGAFVARRDSVGRLSPLRALPGDLVAGPVALADGTFATVLGEPAGAGACGEPSRADLAGCRPTAGWSLGWRLRRHVGDPPAEGAGGVAVVASIAGRTLRAVVRGRNGTSARPVVVARSGDTGDEGLAGLGLAVTPDGGALVTYALRRRVHAVTLRPDGTVARRRVLGPADELTATAVVVGGNGRAGVLWWAQDGGEERGEPTSCARRSSPPAARGLARLAAFEVGSGDALVLGLSRGAGRLTLRRRSPGAAAFGAEEPVPGGRVREATVELGPGGRPVAAWIVRRGATSAVRVAERGRR